MRLTWHREKRAIDARRRGEVGVIPITTREQFDAAKQAAEQMTEIHLFGAIYLVRQVMWQDGVGAVDLERVQRVEEKHKPYYDTY